MAVILDPPLAMLQPMVLEGGYRHLWAPARCSPPPSSDFRKVVDYLHDKISQTPRISNMSLIIIDVSEPDDAVLGKLATEREEAGAGAGDLLSVSNSA